MIGNAGVAVQSVIGAGLFLLGHRRAFLLALVPACLCLTVVGGTVYFGHGVLSHVVAAPPPGAGFILRWASQVGFLAMTLVEILFALVIGFLVTEPLSVILGIPDRLVLLQKETLAPQAVWPPEPPSRVLFRSLRVLLVGLLIQIPAITCQMAGVLAGVVWAPFGLPFLLVSSLLLSWWYAWAFLDYPFSLAGFGIRARLAWFFRQKAAVTTMGFLIFLLLYNPLLFPLTLPVAVVAATRLFLTIGEGPAG